MQNMHFLNMYVFTSLKSKTVILKVRLLVFSTNHVLLSLCLWWCLVGLVLGLPGLGHQRVRSGIPRVCQRCWQRARLGPPGGHQPE